MTESQKSLLFVLDRMKKMALESNYIANDFIGGLDAMLDDLLAEDIFGTEGQMDPRGDQREGEWTVDNPQRLIKG